MPEWHLVVTVSCLKLVAVRPMYVSFMSWVLTVAWYTTSLTRQSPLSGHSSFFLQLQFSLCLAVVVLFWRSSIQYALLCPSINCCSWACSCSWVSKILLNSFLSLWPMGKDLLMRLMKALLVLVLTFLLYGGLNRLTFLHRLQFCVGGPCGGGLNSSLCVYLALS